MLRENLTFTYLLASTLGRAESARGNDEIAWLLSIVPDKFLAKFTGCCFLLPFEARVSRSAMITLLVLNNISILTVTEVVHRGISALENS